MDLKADVFEPVAKRIKSRSDSLSSVKKFSRSGIEAWLKVEAVAALDGKIKALQNHGPDLLLTGKVEIELKGATDLSPAWIVGSALKYGCPCLFLGDGQQQNVERLLADTRVSTLAYEIFSDGVNPWVIGIIAPKKSPRSSLGSEYHPVSQDSKPNPVDRLEIRNSNDNTERSKTRGDLLEQEEETPPDAETREIRELLKMLYSGEIEQKNTARRKLHSFLLLKFKTFSKNHLNVSHYGNKPLWEEGTSFTFPVEWNLYGDARAIVSFKLPKPTGYRSLAEINFRVFCTTGTNKNIEHRWQRALLAIRKLREIFPNIEMSDSGKSKKARVVYNFNNINVTAKDIDDMVKTLAVFFDTIDAYLNR